MVGTCVKVGAVKVDMLLECSRRGRINEETKEWTLLGWPDI